MSRLYLLCCLVWGLIVPLNGQGHYVLNGLTVIRCDVTPQTYTLDTNGNSLSFTSWQLTPTTGAQIISSGLYDATIQFISSGYYTLVAVSSTPNQQLLTDSLFILVIGSLGDVEVGGCYSVNPVSKCYQVCAHSTTTIYDPNAVSEWEVTGASSYTLSGQTNINVTWGDAGNGTVTSFGDCGSTLCFEILPQPTAGFITDPSSPTDTLVVCRDKEISFINTSFNGLSYDWSFGDGQQLHSFNATHTYSAEGDYLVTLSAMSVCECVDEKQMVVRVLPAPAPTLDCVNTVCPESRQIYTATTDGCTQFTWTVSANGTVVNGGGINDDFIEIIWHDGPDGIIGLSLANCNSVYCSFSNVFRIPILSPDGPISGDASVCTGEIVNYSAPYFPGTQYQWQVGPKGTIVDGQNSNVITIHWDDVNTITNSQVTVDYNDCFLGCSGSAVLNISITPEIIMTADEQVCQNDMAIANTTAGFITPLPASVMWHLEDSSGQIIFTLPGVQNSFTHTFNYPPGIYQWVAVNSSAAYCTDILRKKIRVTATPDAPLGIQGDTIICPGQTYGFSIVAAGNFATIWTIVDGANTYTAKGQSCQHTFGTTPPYSVSAIHADIQFAACTSDPVTIMLHTINEYSISGQAEVCYNGINSFSIPYVSGSDYTWEVIPADHGTIKRSDLNQADVFWTQSGPCTLRLQACGSTIDKPINVHPLPSFTLLGPLAACSNEKVMLSTDQPLLSHQWKNENDILIGNLNNIQLLPGTYAVEVADTLGCADEQAFTITTYPAPVVNVSCTMGNSYCTSIPGGVDLVANTDGSGYTFLWFKDGLPTGSTGPVYNVTDFADYHVEVTNQYGCRTVSPDITFYNCCTPPCGGGGGPLPNDCTYLPHDFSITKVEMQCQVHEFTPHDAGIIPGETQWNIASISDGVFDIVHADILNYTYTLPGYYFIGVTSLLTGFPYTAVNCGHGEIIIDTVLAVANFKFDGVCVNSDIAFEDLTTFLPGEMIVDWNWNFDDPASGTDNISSLQDPLHVFSSGGDYEVTLTITLLSGCQSSKVQTVHISEGPALNPTYEPIYCEKEALALDLPDQVFNVMWDFGDPGSGVLNAAESEFALHTYAASGLYTPMVSATDVFGCISNTSLNVDIRPNNLSGLINVDPAGTLCYGDTATLTSPPIGESWLWSTGEITSQIEVTESNPYSLLIEDEFHCTYAPPPVTVIIQPKPDLIIHGREILDGGEYGPWQSELHICQGTEFELEAFSSTPPFFYHWTHGPLSKTISFTDEGGNLPGAGFYEFSAYILAAGCTSDTASFQVEIFDLPQQPALALSGGSGCSFDLNTIEVTNPEAGVDYHWSDGQQGTSINTQNAGSYFVIAINAHGCSSTSSAVTIQPSAPIDQIPGGCHIECDPLTVCLPPIENVASWSIFQNGSLFDSGIIWPTDYLISTDGSYTVEVTTTNGCTATSDPLDIVLYTGVGSVTVLTYLDVDHDGMITAADMLLSGIPVEIISDDGSQAGMTYTLANGGFVFEDFPATGYTAYFNPLLLSSQYKIVIDSVQTNILTCGDSVIVSLLLEENCIVSGPDLLIESCPGEDVMVGDSIWSDTGQYTLHLMSAGGCDSVFMVIIQWPDSFQIGATVWVDVDQNGILSPADTVVQGVTIVFDPVINHLLHTEVTDSHGTVLGNFPTGNYIVSIDSTSLSPGLTVLYGLDVVPDTICGVISFNFLLSASCADVFLVQTEEICEGDSIFVQGQWITSDGVYSFLLSQPGSGCDTMLDVYVTLLPSPVISAQTGWDCIHQGSIDLSVSGTMPYQYLWNLTLPGDSTLTGLQDGAYMVTITDGNGCETTDTFYIQSPPILEFDLPNYYEVIQGDSVEISLTGSITASGLTFQWSPSQFLSCPTCPATWAFPDSSTTLTVIIHSEDSCLYELETFINVTLDSSTFDQIYIPNVFSPNGDGINDYWRVYSRLDNTYVNTLTIFDRWGELLFHKENYEINTFEGWDGTFRGKSMQPGVFTYVGEVTLGNGTKQRVKGNVTLIR